VRQFEEDNSMLQTFNDKFGNENDKLMIESNELKAELIRYCQYRVLRNIPSPIMDKRSATLNETNAEEARTEVKNLMKGQIPAKYQLDYEKTFFEQSTTVYEKLIPELKRLMDGVFNPSTRALEKVDRRLHANTQLSEKKNRQIKMAFKLFDTNEEKVSKFDKNERSEKERIYNDKVYFTSNKTLENISEWATSQNKFLYETDWTNKTNKINHNFDAEIDINDGDNDYLIDFLMDEIRPEDFDEESESSMIASQIRLPLDLYSTWLNLGLMAIF
ncbi:17466_t:CDS:2, partial [Funneliformis caledonium]